MIRFEFISEEDIYIILPFLQILNTKIPEKLLESRLDEMVKNDYQCMGIFDDEALIGICGIWVLVKYYVGKHLEVDNVVILPEYRGQNIGENLMRYIEEYALSIDCLAVELNCYVHNTSGNHFWEKKVLLK